MANAVNVNFRMDPDLKRSMEEVCAEMGLSRFSPKKFPGSTAFPLRFPPTRSTRKATSIISARSSTTSIPEKPSSPSTI